jgi:hypothetical protein
MARLVSRGKQAEALSLTLMAMNAIHTLLRQTIDYAGLFPPAALDMRTAVNNYVAYRESPDAWALGRFIVPALRLREFAEEAAARAMSSSGVWQLNVLIGPDLHGDLGLLADLKRNTYPPMNVAGIEMKADSAHAIQEAIRAVPEGVEVYFELPIDPDPAPLLASVGQSAARAKVRTGGVTSEAFPSTASLDRFIRGCIRAQVPFKATAGLHHAVRGEYPLTYEKQSLRSTMFGFLNLFLATALAQSGASESETGSILEESAPDAFRVEDGIVRWRDRRFAIDQVTRARECIVSFGSCSFTEPTSELHALFSLQPDIHQA